MNLRWRLIPTNQPALDLADIFQVDGYTRITGLSASNVAIAVFCNNVPQPWTTLNGAGLTDAQLLAGHVYWHEVGAGTGYYSVRWRPNGVGFWRVLITYAAVPQVTALDYDVVAFSPESQGLKVSFVP